MPWSIALNLTFPETVTPGNRQRLQLLADAPALCARLRAGEFAARREAPQLLAAYAADRREALLQARK